MVIAQSTKTLKTIIGLVCEAAQGNLGDNTAYKWNAIWDTNFLGLLLHLW